MVQPRKFEDLLEFIAEQSINKNHLATIEFENAINSFTIDRFLDFIYATVTVQESDTTNDHTTVFN